MRSKSHQTKKEKKMYFSFPFCYLIFFLCLRSDDHIFKHRSYLLGKDFHPSWGSFWSNSDFSVILGSLNSTPRISPSAQSVAISQKPIKQQVEFPSL